MRLAKTRNTTRLKCCACNAKWPWTRPQCCACHENCNASSENIAKVLRLPLQTIFDTWQFAWMSRSATPATRNEATRHVQPPKATSFAELTIGTAIVTWRGRLRTVANINATSSEHTLNPQTPRVKRDPLLRIREKDKTYIRQTKTTWLKLLQQQQPQPKIDKQITFF